MPKVNPIHISGGGDGYFRITVKDPDAVFMARSVSIHPAPFHAGRLLMMGGASLVSGEVQILTKLGNPEIVYYVPAYGETPSATLKHYVMRNL